MPTNIEHYDLSGRRTVVVGANTPAGSAIAAALTEAGATVSSVDATEDAVAAGSAVERARDELGGLEIAVSATDLFFAKPIAEVTDAELARVTAANFSLPFAVARAAAGALAESVSGRLILVSHVLGERGVTNTSAYGAAHAATQSLVRTLSQELGPQGTAVNGISLGWMEWMHDRLDPADQEAMRAVRFPIMKRTGTGEDVGPMAVWLSGTGAGYVSGQIFTIDGGLLQHL
jgi:NAD(P)-dependent dehydrogenase (short-subunit alcohol dehydrogenase family)